MYRKIIIEYQKAKWLALQICFLRASLRTVSVDFLRSDRKQFSLHMDKSNYTSVLLVRHFTSGNTAVSVTRPNALSNVIIHK